MIEATFPKPVAEIVTTIADIFRHHGQTDIVELLENAHAYLEETEFDNWNGGTYTWALRLDVPVPLFAAFESRLGDLEKDIGSKLGYFSRHYPNHNLNEVTISPINPNAAVLCQRMAPSEQEVKRLWPHGRFRLFLSHVSKYKIEVSKLKDELALRGLEAFVAHEDIEPSLKWREEIELALRSMQSLAALLTPEFHASEWTDQEIGWALGRGIPVIPVMLGVGPYGLAGKFQGVRGSFQDTKRLAVSILSALLANQQTHGEMRRALVSAFSTAQSHVMAQALRKVIVTVTDFTEEEKATLRRACVENVNVSEAYYVTDAIFKTFGAPVEVTKPSAVDENLPF